MMRGSLCVCPVLSAFLEDLQFWAVKSAGFDLHPEGSGAFFKQELGEKGLLSFKSYNTEHEQKHGKRNVFFDMFR